jgi:hypothetical protein
VVDSQCFIYDRCAEADRFCPRRGAVVDDELTMGAGVDDELPLPPVSVEDDADVGGCDCSSSRR